MINHPHRNKKNPVRTTQGLRDVLFDEIEELRSGEGDPTKSMAVANLAKQIINVAKIELDFHRQIAAQAQDGSPVKMGTLQLGTDPRSNAGSAAANATAA
jgi:hypothetical protein